MKRWIWAGACLSMLAPGCGGDLLHIGYDDGSLAADPTLPVDRDALAKRCAAPRTAPLPSGSPDDQFAAAGDLIAGRWFLCPFAVPSGVPGALELTARSGFVLGDSGSGVFVRGAPQSIVLAYNVRSQHLEITREQENEGTLLFERNPLRMTWSKGTSVHLFVKG